MSQDMREVATVIAKMVAAKQASSIVTAQTIANALDKHARASDEHLPALQEALLALAERDAIRVRVCESCDGMRKSYAEEQKKRTAAEREREALIGKLHANTLALADERRLISAMKVEARNNRVEIARLNRELKEARRAAKTSKKETNK